MMSFIIKFPHVKCIINNKHILGQNDMLLKVEAFYRIVQY